MHPTLAQDKLSRDAARKEYILKRYGPHAPKREVAVSIHSFNAGWELHRQMELQDTEKPMKYKTEELYDADPKCEHEVYSAPSGGVKCKKCTGWFCF